MKHESAIFRSLLAAAALAGVSAAHAAGQTQTPMQAIDAEVNAQMKSRAKFREIVESLERRIAGEDVRTNAALRVSRR